jgi:hypothetical protein
MAITSGPLDTAGRPLALIRLDDWVRHISKRNACNTYLPCALLVLPPPLGPGRPLPPRLLRLVLSPHNTRFTPCEARLNLRECGGAGAFLTSVA